MSSAPRKPLHTNTTPTGRRTLNENTLNKSSGASMVPSSTGHGQARTPSLHQSRPARKTLSRSSTSLTTDLAEDEDDANRMSSAQLISELKEQVRKAEEASENYRKQLEVLQSRLDDSTEEQTAIEEREQQRQSELDSLHIELKDVARQRREMEQSYEDETKLILRERDKQKTKEVELQAVISRLNESLRTKELRWTSVNRISTLQESSPFDDQRPVTSQTHLDAGIPPDVADAVSQRDATIEALTLELAETQIKIAEMEHRGDGRLQELEKILMETKMTNARLREDNESFQYLLGEKTLKGDFLHDSRTLDGTSGLNSLAEELESAGDDPDAHTEAYKKFEAEIKNLREGNKALTLYIDKIIGRLLQHDGFEHIILDNSDGPELPAKPAAAEKALPATPTPILQPATSLLQRAKSVVSRPGPKARPVSYMPPHTTVNENVDTAPSIPLNRGHRRARSDQAQKDMGAAALVAQMNRGSPLRTVSGGAMGSGISPLSPQLNPSRASYFQSAAAPGTRTSLGGVTPRDRDRGSSANSLASEQSGEKDSTDTSSAQTSTHGPNNIPGAVMKQNQLRPLRLVREQTLNDEQEAQKKANRGSTWMGWLKGSSLEANHD